MVVDAATDTLLRNETLSQQILMEALHEFQTFLWLAILLLIFMYFLHWKVQEVARFFLNGLSGKTEGVKMIHKLKALSKAY